MGPSNTDSSDNLAETNSEAAPKEREGRRGRRRPRVNGRHSRFIALRSKSPHHVPSRLTLSPLRYDLDQAILPRNSRMILYIYIYLFIGFIITDECAEYSLTTLQPSDSASIAITPRIV